MFPVDGGVGRLRAIGVTFSAASEICFGSSAFGNKFDMANGIFFNNLLRPVLTTA